MDKVMRGIKQRNLEIVSQKMEIDCKLIISVRESEAERALLFFEEMQHVRIKKME